MKHGNHNRSFTINLGLVLSCLALAVGCGGGAEVAETEGVPAGPHPVIIVAIDGLRADALGAYGGENATPNFDRLADESVHFKWAFAQTPEAASSVAALLTGLYPTTSGVVEPGDRVPEEATTLAEAASAAGIKTAGFFEGAAGGDDFGLAQGFSQFNQSDNPGAGAMEWITQHAGEDFLMMLKGWSVGLVFGPDVDVDGVAAPEGFYDRLQLALASNFTDDPVVLEPQDLDYVKVLYASRIRTADHALGELLSNLDGLGLSDRATIVVTGTKGIDLQQHGAIGGISLHSTVTRVPMFIRLPKGQAAGPVDKIVEHIDLMPTVLDLVGAATPPGVQGASLVPIIEGTGRPPYIAFSESPHLGGQRAVAMGGVRMVTSSEDGETALFDLGTDPNELTDIADTGADRIEVLQRHLEAWSKMVSATSLDPERRTEEELDDETLEQLKSLGYIQ